MRKLSRVALISCAALAIGATANAGSEKPEPKEVTLDKAVRKSLERLPYYGVFDILNYQIGDNGVVEVGGFVFNDSLKQDAEDAVAKVPGVRQVVNRIEDLEWGVSDDEIRAKVYLTIYRDSFLSRYGTATDIALANGVGLAPRGRLGFFGPMGIGNPYLPGFNPSGDYGIHILVTRGEVILMGEVDTEGDKILAGLKSRGVFPVKKVFNELSVRNGNKEEKPAPRALPRSKRGIVAAAEES